MTTRTPALLLLAALALSACGGDRVQRRHDPDPIPEPACGDGKVDEGEDCDGSDLAGQSCSTLGFDYGSLNCTDTCQFNTVACVKLCGDGAVGPGEECDGDLGPLSCPDWGYKVCTAQCRMDALHCGTKTFTPAAPVAFPAGGPSLLTDLAPEGYGDLVTAIPEYFRLQTHAFDTTAGFKQDRILSRMNDGVRPLRPIAGDLDGDGHRDLAAINVDGSADRYRYEPPGAGTPTGRFVVEPLDAPCPLERWVGAGNVDREPGTDLVALGCPGAMAVETWDAVIVFGGGTVPAAPVQVSQPGMLAAMLADDDRDGVDDLLLLLHGGEVVIRRGPEFEASDSLSLGFAPAGIAAAGDLDGDGDADLVVGDVAGGLRVLENLGVGLASTQTFSSAGADHVLVRDLDLDGRPDIAWVAPGRLEVRRNLGDFVFTAHGFTLPEGTPLSLAAGDLEGDGDPDLVIALGDPPAVATSTQVWINEVR